MSDHEPDGNDLLGGRREGVCGGSSARRTREAGGGSPAWRQLGSVALRLDARRPGDDGVGALRQDGGSEWRCQTGAFVPVRVMDSTTSGKQ
jgi:hypothetical protein